MAHYSVNKKHYLSETEIFKTYANRVAFTGYVVAEGLTPDEDGDLVIPRGTVIDKDGKVSSVSGGTGSDPAGIIDKTVIFDSKDDIMEAPIIVEGYLKGARLNVTDHEDYSAITTALPEIKIDPEKDPEE